jgi:hypothetical protein
LIRNPEHFCRNAEDRFKVWPTNRDRAAFNDVMAATLPVDYLRLPHRESRMTQAHQFFSGAMTDWLTAGSSESRAEALTQVLLNGLQLVVIQLEADEDSQEIFETLNARGTPLTAADLIKNFVFQRLDLPANESEAAYEKFGRSSRPHSGRRRSEPGATPWRAAPCSSTSGLSPRPPSP